MTKKRSKKRKASSEGQLRRAIVLLVTIVIIASVGYFGWRQVSQRVIAKDEYRLHPNRIEISPPPAWIQADVRSEVIRDGSLDRPMSLLDDDLGQRIAAAFELHPWIARAKVTKKYPGSVHVELIYRKPVMVVSLAGGANLELLPVDVQGFHLPSDDLSHVQKRSLPRLIGISNLPLVGQGSKDPRVLGAARLAGLLESVWTEFRLARILPPDEHGSLSEETPAGFQLVTYGNTKILWGAGPGNEDGEEISAKEKLTRLKAYFEQRGTLDSTGGSTTLDVRELPGPTSTVQRPQVSG